MINTTLPIRSVTYKGQEIPIYTTPQEVTLQDKTVTPTKQPQEVTADATYSGLGTVTVNAIPDEYIVPTGTKDITSNGVQDVTAYASVNVNVPDREVVLQNKTVSPTEQQQVVNADSNYDGLGSVTVGAVSSTYIGSDVPRQSATAITPTKSSQSVTGGKYLDGNITINPIPDEYIVPTGSQTITSNGQYNVTEKAQVLVEVPAPSLQTKTVSPSEQQQTITPDSTYDGLSSVTVNAIQTETKSVTQNGTVTPTSGKYLKSVTVNIPDPTYQTKTVTPTESQQVVTPDSAYDGLSQVTVNAISSTYVGSNVPRQSATTITPTKSAQTVTSGKYLTGNITIGAIPDQYITTTDANATAGNIVSGQTAYVNGQKVTGTMVVNRYYTGSDTPASSLGSNGDIYLKV